MTKYNESAKSFPNQLFILESIANELAELNRLKRLEMKKSGYYSNFTRDELEDKA